VFDILGLVDSDSGTDSNGLVEDLMQTIIDIRKDARERKEWGVSDFIRDELAKYGITLKDGKDGTSWLKK